MNVDKWIEALQHPLVLAGFGLFLFAALIKPLFLNNEKLSGTAMERLLHKGMNFAFTLALLAIAGGLLLDWKDGSKAAANKEKNVKISTEGVDVNQTIDGSNISIDAATVMTYGLSKEQYEEQIKKLLNELAAKSQNAATGQRALLEQKLKVVGEKFSDIEKSYKEEIERRKAADDALAQMKGQLPDEQIKQAKLKLEQGETTAAEKAFDAVVEKEGGAVALAAYQSGQLAEGRLDYDKAMIQYKKAVILEEYHTEYLFAAGKMARAMAEYRQAEDWFRRLLKISEQRKYAAELVTALNNLTELYEEQGRYEDAVLLHKRILTIREQKLGKKHPSVAATLKKLAWTYEVLGRYEQAESLYQQAISIMKSKFPGGHPNIDVMQQNYDELKRKMAEQQ
ncbi:MAG: Tetratricopeptide repeat-containing protein [Candidatus Electronema aureum]|uniref:Tetratricopeptide repeat-containing protein n=1 Tax=Candidatus Electronema aureum TaxID=2005002 RepID=A0A521G329_9BACT|nr:MAG: Tetratricopeptide repeat-containing protein [Candidatus Electronema aureum]